MEDYFIADFSGLLIFTDGSIVLVATFECWWNSKNLNQNTYLLLDFQLS
jgi:hypothetical protein